MGVISKFCANFQCDLAKPSLKRGHGWAIIFQRNYGTYVYIHIRNDMLAFLTYVNNRGTRSICLRRCLRIVYLHIVCGTTSHGLCSNASWKMFKFLWWRHQMETFSAFLALCEGNLPAARSFDVFFGPNKRLSKQSRRWWSETPSRSSWRHCNVECGFL